MERKQVPVEKTWKIEDLYADDAAFEADYAKLAAKTEELALLKGTLSGGSGKLLAVLESYYSAMLILEHIYSYAMMSKDTDSRSPKFQALHERAQNAYVRFGEASSYITPELLAMPVGTAAAWVEQNDGLKIYARMISEAERMRPHTLDEQGERLLAMAGDVLAAPDAIFSMIDDADIRFDPIQDENGKEAAVTHGSYSVFLESRDRRVRKDAFTSMLSAFEKQKNTIGTTYASSVKADVFIARARNFAGSLDAALKPNEVPQSVYDNLLATIESNAPVMQRYIDLRKRALGIDEVHFYDLYVAIASDWDLRLPYEEAAETVRKALAPMGGDYMRELDRAFESRWIDVCETEGKRSGAYSNGVFGVHPYVLLNYQESLDNIFTIAHEMGHAMHSFYSAKTQPYPTADYVIFVAEVASTVNELILLDYLTKNAPDDGARAALLNHKLESIRGTVYRQTLFAAFEKASHAMAEAGEPLTNDALCAVYRDLYGRFYPGLVIDDLLPYEWMRIPHFYRAFYVYQYATGYSAAVALSRGILQGKPGALENYLKFLSGGGSMSPLDLLRGAGVDMSSPAPVEACMKEFEETLTLLEGLL